MTIEAETGVLRPQAKGHQGLLAASGSGEEAWDRGVRSTAVADVLDQRRHPEAPALGFSPQETGASAVPQLPLCGLRHL